MDRVTGSGYRGLIAAAYELIPGGLHHFIRPDFLCGVDPVFAGLHHYVDASYGRSYREIAHVAYDFHQRHLPASRRRVTVVIPERRGELRLGDLVHELGHVLDATLSFDWQAEPVGPYAATSRYEAFADAFAAWALPFGHGYAARKDRLYAVDRATVALFEGLAA